MWLGGKIPGPSPPLYETLHTYHTPIFSQPLVCEVHHGDRFPVNTRRGKGGEGGKGGKGRGGEGRGGEGRGGEGRGGEGRGGEGRGGEGRGGEGRGGEKGREEGERGGER